MSDKCQICGCQINVSGDDCSGVIFLDGSVLCYDLDCLIQLVDNGMVEQGRMLHVIALAHGYLEHGITWEHLPAIKQALDTLTNELTHNFPKVFDGRKPFDQPKLFDAPERTEFVSHVEFP